MLTLAWPWMLTLLPLPLVAWYLLPPASSGAAALRARLYARFAGTTSGGASRGKWRVRVALLTLLWLALLTATARPQWVGDPIRLSTSGRDLLLAVDISESMQMEDMRVDKELLPRLTVVKDVVGNFIERREGDRMGLILFGSRAYLQVPLTFDHRTLKQLLEEALIGFAGRATAIGDAIGIAIKRLRDRPENSRVLILLSDGADTASELPPRKAAQLAARHDIRIYTVGIGADQLTRRSFFGNRTFNPSAELDEDMLKDIADLTGGRYFRARDPEQLQEVYRTLDELEPVEQEGETLRPTDALFHWPLGMAFGLFGILVVWRGRGGEDG